MNRRQAKRLLNVARSVDESPSPSQFSMRCYLNTDLKVEDNETHWCGTPGCNLGHYGSRPDLQRILKVGYRDDSSVGKKPTLLFLNNQEVNYASRSIQRHFGVNEQQCEELFGWSGCGNAQTPAAAAKYIRAFVRRVYGTVPVIGEFI